APSRGRPPRRGQGRGLPSTARPVQPQPPRQPRAALSSHPGLPPQGDARVRRAFPLRDIGPALVPTMVSGYAPTVGRIAAERLVDGGEDLRTAAKRAAVGLLAGHFEPILRR